MVEHLFDKQIEKVRFFLNLYLNFFYFIKTCLAEKVYAVNLKFIFYRFNSYSKYLILFLLKYEKIIYLLLIVLYKWYYKI